MAISASDAVDLAGYSLEVNYDAGALVWLGAAAGQPSLFTGPEGSAAIQVARQPGEILVSDVLALPNNTEGDGQLLVMRFRLVDPTSSGRVEIARALVADSRGNIQELMGQSVADVRALPDGYALGGNFPNPFNPETQIHYQLPEAADVSLVVYNLLGQEVRVLVQERQDAGFCRVVWDGRDALGRSVSSGVYLTRMASGGFSSVRKMLMLK